jgi:hypothetical protein
VRPGRGELAARSALAPGIDDLPHPLPWRKCKAPREHLAEPLALALDDLEQSRSRLEDADEGEALGMWREDPAVERELPALAATEFRGQRRKADPVAGREDDRVRIGLAAVAEYDAVARKTADPRPAIEGALAQGALGLRRHDGRPAGLEQPVSRWWEISPVRRCPARPQHRAEHEAQNGQRRRYAGRPVELVER